MKQESLEQVITLQKLAKVQGGVFSKNELMTVLNCECTATYFNKLKSLVSLNLLSKLKNGFYVTKDFNPFLLSARIEEKSYISMDSILAINGLIGTMPLKKISNVKLGRNREFTVNNQIIKFYGINEKLFFGYETKEGINYADNEKAFIDLIYFMMKGHKFAINPTTDIDLKKLDKKKLVSYLARYKNKRFVKYIENLTNE
jgi:hypothetical protein